MMFRSSIVLWLIFILNGAALIVWFRVKKKRIVAGVIWGIILFLSVPFFTPFYLDVADFKRIPEKPVILKYHGNEKELILSEKQIDELCKILSEVKVQYPVIGTAKAEYLRDPKYGFSLKIEGENGLNHIYVDWAERENCFVEYAGNTIKYRIEAESVDETAEYLCRILFEELILLHYEIVTPKGEVKGEGIMPNGYK